MSQLTQNGPAATPVVESEERAFTVHPRVDVLETENEFLIFADVPGLRSEDIDVRFENGELAFHGIRQARRESGPISYQRSFGAADTVAADKISAELKSGVLTIHLPKTEAVKPKRIAVRG
jgi:HSP20 family protein